MEPSWSDIKRNNNYEILNVYPYTIRKKSNKKVLKEGRTRGKYISVNLDLKPINKHQLIAEQFLPNPDPEHLTVIDHINRDTYDNHSYSPSEDKFYFNTGVGYRILHVSYKHQPTNQYIKIITGPKTYKEIYINKFKNTI